MGTIASLNVAVKATTDQFEGGMRKARNAAKETGESVKGFSAEMLTSRASIQTFAGITGAAAGPLGHLVHAFEAFPGPIGLAIGAIFALKEAYEVYEESQKKAIESAEKFVEGMREVQKITGEISPVGEFADNAERGLDLIRSKQQAIFQDISEHGNSYGFDTQGAKDQIAAFDAERDKLMEVRTPLLALQSVLDEIDEKKFHIKLYGGDELPQLKEEMDALQEALRHLDKNTPEFRSLTKHLQSVQLEIEKTKDAANKLASQQTAEAAKAAAKADKNVADQFAASVKAVRDHAREITEAFEDPLDKFKEKVDDLKGLLDQGLIDQATFDKATEAAKDLVTTKGNQKSKADSTVKQIDRSLIDVRGLGRSNAEQLIKSPQLEKANEYLKSIAANVGVAVAG